MQQDLGRAVQKAREKALAAYDGDRDSQKSLAVVIGLGLLGLWVVIQLFQVLMANIGDLILFLIFLTVPGLIGFKMYLSVWDRKRNDHHLDADRNVGLVMHTDDNRTNITISTDTNHTQLAMTQDTNRASVENTRTISVEALHAGAEAKVMVEVETLAARLALRSVDQPYELALRDHADLTEVMKYTVQLREQIAATGSRDAAARLDQALTFLTAIDSAHEMVAKNKDNPDVLAAAQSIQTSALMAFRKELMTAPVPPRPARKKTKKDEEAAD